MKIKVLKIALVAVAAVFVAGCCGNAENVKNTEVMKEKEPYKKKYTNADFNKMLRRKHFMTCSSIMVIPLLRY